MTDPQTPSAIADNLRRWDGSTPGRYEVWYLTANHAPTQTGFWIRYTLESPQVGVGEPYAQLWFARFDARDPRRTFGINRKFPIAAMTAAGGSGAPFGVAIAGNHLGADHARGALAGDGHDVRWDLRWPAAGETTRFLPDVMYARGGLGETTALIPTISAALTGTIVVDGVTYDLTGERVGQTHIWGKKHAFAWAWGHCNRFDGDPDAWFEILSPRLRRRGVVLPRLTVMSLRVGGETHAFNQFHHTPFARVELGTGSYTFSGGSLTARVEGEFTCRPEDMVTATYHDPDGEPSYCANTEIGTLTLTFSRRRGLRWQETARLVAPHRGQFEIAGRTRDAAVLNDHETIA
ncbi:MAG: hypothetical protein K8W52_26990 [Deltaproteobacteria bacterium]|nr:hypothetical protein [Deltaproteobacteria bacterium]